MKEIEIRIQISDEQHSILHEWLKQNADHTGQKVQTEYYLDNPDSPFKFQHKLGYVDAEKYLRVRMTPKGDSICIKVFHIDKQDGSSHNLAEHETNVENGEAALELFKASGFTDATKVAKVRDSYKYQNFEIEIDQVEDLGVFVEVEIKDHNDDTEAGRAAIFELLKQIGIANFTEQNRGYVSMLWNPRYNFGTEINL